VATEQEDAVNMQLASGKGFGTTGIKGMTDAQVNALSTDALIKNVNDTLSTGVGTLSGPMPLAAPGTHSVTSFPSRNISKANAIMSFRGIVPCFRS